MQAANEAALHGEVVDPDDEQSNTLALRPRSTAVAQWTPTFAVSVEAAVNQVRMKEDFMRQVMKKDQHYGVIPGTKGKPSLYKPGAEVLLSSMALHPEFGDAAPPVIDLSGREHGGESYVEFRRFCRIYRQIGPAEHERMLVAKAEGASTSWEKKYRYRGGGIVCPDCGQPLRRSKTSQGWYCWNKPDKGANGCGANFNADDQRVTKQSPEPIKNPDVADTVNTLLKMADKRALVAATLLATGCSDLFTQDVEDFVDVEHVDTDDSGYGYGVPADEAPPVSDGNTTTAPPSPAPAQPQSQPSGNRRPEYPPCPNPDCNKGTMAVGQYKTPEDPSKPYFCSKNKGGCGESFGVSEAPPVPDGQHHLAAAVTRATSAGETPSAPADGVPPPLTEAQAKELGELHSLLPLDLQMSGEERKKLVAGGFEYAKATLEARQDEALSRSASPQEEQPQQSELPS